VRRLPKGGPEAALRSRLRGLQRVRRVVQPAAQLGEGRAAL